MATFPAPLATGPIDLEAAVPPSKSVHQRALLLAVLGPRGATTTIEAAGAPSGDVLGLAAALSSVAGVPVPCVGEVPGAVGDDGALGRSRDRRRLMLGMNGTGLRLLTTAVGLRPRGARTLLTGAPRLRARPHGALVRALGRLGAHVHRKPSGALRVIATPWTAHAVSLPLDRSSQPASSILLSACRAGGVTVRVVGPAVSRGYLGLTRAALAAFGVPSEERDGVVTVPAATPRCAHLRVEPDASSAAVWWAAAALTGGRARVAGLPRRSAQPDLALLPVLERMGASVRAGADGVPEVVGPGGGLRGAGEVDLRDAPDLAPLVAALGAAAEGGTRVTGAPHLRDKESDRVATVVAAVRAVGGEATPTDDGFEVLGRAGALRGGRVAVAGDHRIALAFGVLGLAVPGVVLDGVEAVSKSYPGFPEALAAAADPDRGRPSSAP